MINRKKNNVANVLQAFALVEQGELQQHPTSFFLDYLKSVQYITTTANISNSFKEKTLVHNHNNAPIFPARIHLRLLNLKREDHLSQLVNVHQQTTSKTLLV